MSGGSMDYLYIKVEEAAGDLCRSSMPIRRIFGAHLKNVARALHDIEWVDSCDYGEGKEVEAIEKAIAEAGADRAKLDEAEKMIVEATNILLGLRKKKSHQSG